MQTVSNPQTVLFMEDLKGKKKASLINKKLFQITLCMSKLLLLNATVKSRSSSHFQNNYFPIFAIPFLIHSSLCMSLFSVDAMSETRIY